MDKLEIKILESVNGVKYGTSMDMIHKVFGNNYKTDKVSELDSKNKEFLDWVDKQFSEMTGRPVDDFSKYNDEKDCFESSDYYSFARIDYDEYNRFEAIEVYADKQTELIIDGKDYSDFNLQKLINLADDFILEENETAYTSYKKQISIWCPEGNAKVECVIFGCPDYFTKYFTEMRMGRRD